MDTIVCPFCFRSLRLADAPLRRTRLPPDSPDLVIDDRIAAYYGQTPEPLPPLLPAARRSWGWWPDRSWAVDHNKCCTHCGLPLPLAIATGELRPRVVAVVGDRASGKSTYIGMLLHQLIDGRLADRAGFSVVAQGTFHLGRGVVSSRELYDERYGKTLFGERARVPATLGVRQNPNLRSPLIYRLNFDHRSWWHRLTRPWASHRALDLVLFDTAGEDLEDEAEMDQNYRYLAHASAVLFLVDPTRLANLVPRLDERLRRRAGETKGRFGAVLEAFLNLMERHGAVRAERPIHKPVAFVLTMLDELRDAGLLPPGSPLQSPSRHVGGFDAADARRVSAEAARLMREWGGVEVGNLRRFADARYFALTALGHRPDEAGYLARLQPERVVDPLFWALHRLGYLPAMAAGAA